MYLFTTASSETASRELAFAFSLPAIEHVWSHPVIFVRRWSACLPSCDCDVFFSSSRSFSPFLSLFIWRRPRCKSPGDFPYSLFYLFGLKLTNNILPTRTAISLHARLPRYATPSHILVRRTGGAVRPWGYTLYLSCCHPLAPSRPRLAPISTAGAGCHPHLGVAHPLTRHLPDSADFVGGEERLNPRFFTCITVAFLSLHYFVSFYFEKEKIRM